VGFKIHFDGKCFMLIWVTIIALRCSGKDLYVIDYFFSDCILSVQVVQILYHCVYSKYLLLTCNCIISIVLTNRYFGYLNIYNPYA
jgi:hypothetical protein